MGQAFSHSGPWKDCKIVRAPRENMTAGGSSEQKHAMECSAPIHCGKIWMKRLASACCLSTIAGNFWPLTAKIFLIWFLTCHSQNLHLSLCSLAQCRPKISPVTVANSIHATKRLPFHLS